ncbi:MAG TPA: polysaccharide biosynthesis/export family protein [Pyrinomonadaceae bacterium]|nr:polysaccharide biosynthesis/export family protein [Pyrinomonadaceae bacterium]
MREMRRASIARRLRQFRSRGIAGASCGVVLLACCVGVLLACVAGPVMAQQAVGNTAPAAGERYRIGVGDVLDIRIFNKPQLSRDNVRVDGRGMIRMPLIAGEIQAACRTEEELSREITARYLEYLRNPQVDVFIKDYQSQPVSILGAVRTPSRFQLQRRVRLLELLSFAGGPSDSAGRNIQIVHTAPVSLCEAAAQPDAEQASLNVLDDYKLSETLRGDEGANPFVRPGDVISISEAEQVFVVGNVVRPSTLTLKERVTVSRAIAMSGGTLPDTKSDHVRIVRQAAGTTTKTEIFVDLKAIDRRKAEDVVLQAGDIVDVPTSGGKRILRSLVGAVVPSVGQLPVRVIP